MKNLKKDRKKIVILIIIFSLILIFMYNLAKNRDVETRIQDDFIFFKLFNSASSINNHEKTNNNFNRYNMEVTKEKANYQEINLWQTIDMKSLVKEKVAPGTKGNFSINLTSNIDTEYEIKIVAKNEKPKNLIFEIKEPQGKIRATKSKNIPISWEWKYQINETQDIQDTKDGEKIKDYKFEICTIGK